MSGGGVDWPWICILVAILGVVWVIASRKRLRLLSNGNGVSERGPHLRTRHCLDVSGKISEARIACERHSEIHPASPAKLTKFSMTSLRHRKGSPKGVQKRQSPVLPTPG